MKIKQLKIKKSLWDAIVSGKKKFEFRKLSKGLESGIYEFVSIKEEGKKHYGECSDEANNWILLDKEGCAFECRCGWVNGYDPVTIVYGTAELTFEMGNPKIMKIEDESFEPWCFIKKQSVSDDDWELLDWDFLESISEMDVYGTLFDIGSYDFIEENYVDRFDFIMYKISDVKENHENSKTR